MNCSRSCLFVMLALLSAGPAGAADNQLTAKQKEAGWQLLFNGVDYSGWMTSSGKPIASDVEDGAIMPYQSGGYVLVHEKQFGNFVLSCDVKGEENSGIFVRIGDLKNPVQTGIEIQVERGGTDYHSFGAIYDLVPPSKNVLKPAGEWNHVVVRCKGPIIAVRVNGELVAKMNADEFDQPGMRPDGSKHKFKQAVKDFPRSGYLGFQDHGHKLWFKNVKIREL